MFEKYNGYANYETWCVDLWLNNDEGTYTHWRAAARRHLNNAKHEECFIEGRADLRTAAVYSLSEELCDDIERELPLKESNLYADLLTASLGRIHWREVAESFLEGISEPAASSPASESAGTPRFELGRIVATPAALGALSQDDITAAINRHACGDWGLVGPQGWEENELSLKEGFRVMSVYETAAKIRFWIITKTDRSETTVQLPDDF